MRHDDPTKDSDGIQPDRIDLNSEDELKAWAEKLDVTQSQIRDAVAAAGDRATDVEMYLKGSRSSTNTDRVDEVDEKS
jgi:hypothetical protein